VAPNPHFMLLGQVAPDLTLITQAISRIHSFRWASRRATRPHHPSVLPVCRSNYSQ
jgi:hypothetical protein